MSVPKKRASRMQKKIRKKANMKIKKIPVLIKDKQGNLVRLHYKGASQIKK